MDKKAASMMIEKLEAGIFPERSELISLLESDTNDEELFECARETARKYYGNKIFIRGLIEFSNYCKNNCYYCGIRAGNKKLERYRLSDQEIIDCCRKGYDLGFRTFVLQSGEDPYYTDDILCALIKKIKKSHPDCALTLSIGERSRKSYKALFKAGADRYLLRHEAADEKHYRTLHPQELTPENRKKCLREIKKIGFETGCGFMVGTPGQTLDHIVSDLVFICELEPDMVGLGPFIPHEDTEYKNYPAGSLELCMRVLAVLRLMHPTLLIPATTALSTLDDDAQIMGIMAGANVIMPNLSPIAVREKYLLYNNKKYTDSEAAERLNEIRAKLTRIGYEIVVSRGDRINIKNV